MAATVLVSLFAVVCSAASVSGTTMAGTGPAAVFTSNDGKNYYFAVDSAGALWYTSNGTWSSLGGVCTASPAAVGSSSGSTQINVFVRGTDGAVWRNAYNNGWSSWHSLGGQIAPNAGPAVSVTTADRLQVFVQGTNSALWENVYTGAKWSGWHSLGGILTSSPAATGPDVFVRGADGAAWWKNGSAAWTSLGGQLASGTGPAVSGNFLATNTYYGIHRLFVQGTDHQLWLKSPLSGWNKWVTIGGAPPEPLSISSPGATTNTAGSTIVCITSTSGNIWYSVHDSLGDGLWDQWFSVGSPP